MDQKSIMFFENDDKSNTAVDLYPYSRYFEFEDSYNYYDIDVNTVLLFLKSNNDYVIRYHDVNKITVVPLKLKIKNFYGELHALKSNITLMFIQSDDKELFRKIREIWNKIIEFIGLNIAQDFVKTTLNDGHEFIMVDIHKNTSFAEGSYRGEIIIVLHSVIDSYHKTSLVQVKIHKCV